jgi:DNA-directed RNA polymerase specialized sigma54-like protein
MTITLTREEAQQVLTLLETLDPFDVFTDVRESLRTRLAQPEREWQGLTDEEIDKALWENESNYLPDIIRIAEAKLKEKNR